MRTCLLALMPALVLALGPGTVSGTPVSVFTNSPFVNFDGFNEEADNMVLAASSLGHTVTNFTGFAAADWNAAFAGGSVVVIPELREDLLGAMDAAARSALASNVNGGGGLILAGPTSHTESLLETIFGWSIEFANVSDPSTLNAANAAGTHFADDPATIPANNATRNFTTASLPASSLAIYEDGGTATVFTTSVGTGSVTLLGWDWFSALPAPGTQDGGWNQVYDSAIGHAAGTPLSDPIATPAPGTVVLLVSGLLGLLASRRAG